MKKVVLIGDSIRLSYWQRVKQILENEGVCEVYAPLDNCSYTLNIIRRIRVWFRDMGVEHADLIHWNSGIWEHHRNTDDMAPFSTPEMYLTYNKRLLRQMQKYGDRLIWASTTPAGKHYHYDPNGLCGIPLEEWNREIDLYNGILSSYLITQGVTINDLNSLIGADTDRFITDDGIHLTPEGEEAAAEQVASVIRARLAE
ncbi:MAG: SGNH/GDSL hydrolase family protein [Ruminococcaceae bacterium]|nr:SGNH/GDSL hydrolase family protein [Oscillospiraceae bacterium]